MGTFLRRPRAAAAPAFVAVAAVGAAVLLTGRGHAATAPTFTNFAAPASLGQDAGEPSIGADWSSGNVMFQAGLETLRVNGFDDGAGTASWQSVGSSITSITSLDPILFVDHATGRTFHVSPLSADTTTAWWPLQSAFGT